MIEEANFEIDFDNLTETQKQEGAFEIDSRRHLQKLASQNSRWQGATVVLRRPDEQRENEELFEATITIHTEPTHLSAVGVAGSPEQALQKAVDEIERKSRKDDGRLEQRGNHPPAQ